MPKLHIYLFLLIVIPSGNGIIKCPDITTIQGKLKVFPPQRCTITTYDRSIDSEGSIIPGTWYGKINYKCQDCEGHIISQFEGCTEKWLSISDIKNSNCRPFYVPLILGVITTIISWILIRLLCRIFKTCFEEKVQRIMNTLAFKRGVNLEPLIRWNRVQDDDGNINFEKVEKQPNKRMKTKGRFFKTLMILISIMFGVKQAKGTDINLMEGCDTTLHIKSGNRVCKDNKCNIVITSAISMLPGNVVCMINEKGRRSTMMIDKILMLHYYSPIYLTSSWSTYTASHDICEGSEGCWRGSGCRGLVSDSIPNYVPEVKSIINQTNCFKHSESCSFLGCFYGHRCQYVYWSLKPSGSVHTVYKHQRTEWAIQIIIVSQESIKRVNFESSKPISFDPKMSATLTRNTYIRKSEYYIGNDKSYIPVTASDLDRPILGQIGELQIQLDDTNVYKMARGSVFCSIAGCDYSCMTSTPSIDTIKWEEKSPYKFKQTNTQLLLTESTMDTAHIVFNSEFNYDVIDDKASCKFNVDSVIACYACTTPAQVLISISKQSIISGGLMPIKSDCPSTSQYIRCSEGVDIIEFHVFEKRLCHVFSDGNNETVIPVDPTFLGSLSHTEEWSMSANEVIGLMTNESIWKNFWFLAPIVTHLSLTSIIGIALVIYVICKK